MESAEASFEQLQLQARHRDKKPRKSRDKGHVKACRILILGDGNFSFSLALTRALPPGCEVVATSFDGPRDLLNKYPESPGIVAALQSLGVRVLHNVDATALDTRITGISAIDGHPRHQQQQPAKFDHVIFNHPHTGTEDMRRHRSFLGHFFHAVARPMSAAAAVETAGCDPRTAFIEAGSGSGGNGDDQTYDDPSDGKFIEESILARGAAVHVTLALGQPERWGLKEQAARHDFSLAHRLRFPAEKIDGYMTKRHQTGRSFQQRVQNSETLSFTWTASRASTGTSPKGENGSITANARGRIGSLNDLSGERIPSVADSKGTVGQQQLQEQQQRQPGDTEVVPDNPTGDVGGGKKEEEKERDEEGAATGGSQGVVGASASGITYTLPPWLWPNVRISGAERGRAGAVVPSGGDPDLNANGNHNKGSDGSGGNTRTAGEDAEAGGRADGTKSSRRQATALGALPEVCGLCGRRYKTAQGLRTHVRQFHELGQEGGIPLAPKKERRCQHPGCGRIFTSDMAFEQHMSAKHRGDNVDIKPDWYVGSIYHLEPPPPPSPPATISGVGKIAKESSNGRSNENVAQSVHQQQVEGEPSDTNLRNPQSSNQMPVKTLVPDSAVAKPPVESGGDAGTFRKCDVCGYWFSSARDAQQHLDNLRPAIEDAVTQYECRACNKKFGSRRALLQHANFCSEADSAERKQAS